MDLHINECHIQHCIPPSVRVNKQSTLTLSSHSYCTIKFLQSKTDHFQSAAVPFQCTIQIILKSFREVRLLCFHSNKHRLGSLSSSRTKCKQNTDNLTLFREEHYRNRDSSPVKANKNEFNFFIFIDMNCSFLIFLLETTNRIE